MVFLSSSLLYPVFKGRSSWGKASHLDKSSSVLWVRQEEDSCMWERGRVEGRRYWGKWEMKEKERKEQENRVKSRNGVYSPSFSWEGFTQLPSLQLFFLAFSVDKHIEMNIIERNNYWDLGNAAKEVLNDSVCVFLSNTFVRTLESSKVNESALSIQVKTREKEYQNKSNKFCKDRR